MRHNATVDLSWPFCILKVQFINKWLFPSTYFNGLNLDIKYKLTLNKMLFTDKTGSMCYKIIQQFQNFTQIISDGSEILYDQKINSQVWVYLVSCKIRQNR